MAEERRNSGSSRSQGRSAGARGGRGAGRGQGAGQARGQGRRQDGGRPGRDQRSGGGRPRGRDQRTGGGRQPRRADQSVYDGPDLPDEITGRELDPGVRAQLKGLPEKLAARVARHLAAAGLLVDQDPETAYQHALAAKARAARLAVVREAVGETAYAAGHWSEALSELRAAKRMNGATDYLPTMADCHRALGQAEQALKLARSPSVAGFPAPLKAEMTIVEAGARRDLGQFDAALRTLEQAPLMSSSREPWVVRLRYAYADALSAAGRDEDALAWFHRTHAIDGEQITDAAERARSLESRS